VGDSQATKLKLHSAKWLNFGVASGDRISPLPTILCAYRLTPYLLAYLQHAPAPPANGTHQVLPVTLKDPLLKSPQHVIVARFPRN
jgi:hypothetical protein